MREEHRKTVDQLIGRYIRNPKYPAMIILNPRTPEERKDTKDLTVLLVAADRLTSVKVGHGHKSDDSGLFNVAGCFVDIRIVSFKDLERMAREGEPVERENFRGAWCAYTHLQGLEDLVRQIPG